MIFYTTMKVPVGKILLTGDEMGLIQISFIEFSRNNGIGEWIKNNNAKRDDNFFKEAVEEINQYFQGQRQKFSVKMKMEGTLFQKQVWDALSRIPFGETRSYGEIARKIGRPKAARAVGMACRNNPLAVVIPCHRVVGSDGRLTGFAGGLPVKKKLLTLEKEVAGVGAPVV